MTSFIQNMLWNSVSGFVEEGKRTVGGYAGDALIKAGDLVEGGGRAVGTGIERKATGLGTSLSGQTYGPASAKALPSTARRPAAHRSNSVPANAKPGGSGVPLGAKKSGAGAAKKQGGTAGGAKSSTLGGVQRGVGGLAKPVGGVVNTAGKRTTLPKPFPQSHAAALPKPYPQSGGSLPKPYGSANAFPSADKKTAVRPGQSKPFAPPKEAASNAKKPYPGTNTLPGQASKTPVKKYKPAQRYEPPTKQGEMKHLAF